MAAIAEQTIAVDNLTTSLTLSIVTGAGLVLSKAGNRSGGLRRPIALLVIAGDRYY